MSPDRKRMKVVSLLCYLWGIFSGVYTLLTIIQAFNIGWTVQNGAFAIGALVQTCFGLSVASVGVRGANTPSKALPFMASSIIFAILELMYLIAYILWYALLEPGALFVGSWGMLLSAAAVVLGFVGYFFGRRVYRASLK